MQATLSTVIDPQTHVSLSLGHTPVAEANRSGGGGPPSACTFRLESASVKANALQPGTSVVRVQLVTNIQLELKKVDAVLRLGESPLAPAILRPRAFPLRPLDGMSYKGFVSIAELWPNALWQ